MMNTTILLSRLMGIYCLAMGASMLRRGMMMDIFREVSRQRALSFIMGALMLILGLYVVLVHTKWSSIPEAVVTILGWEVVAEAALFLFASKELVAKYVNTLENKVTYYLITAGYLMLGVYLSYHGFITG